MAVIRRRRPSRRAARTTVLALLAIGLVAAWMLVLRPSTLGGPAGYVIVSGSSMEPLLRTGDLAVVRRQASYENGDVVAYAIPDGHVGRGMLVIHRIIGGSAQDGLILQGDNRNNPDMWRPRHGDVTGSLQWRIPHGGTALFLLRSPLVVAAAAGLSGFWFVALRDRRDGEDLEPSDADTPLPQESRPRPVDQHVPAPASALTPRRDLLGPLAVGLALGLLAGGLRSGTEVAHRG